MTQTEALALYYLLAVSTVSAVICILDKHRAKIGGRRIAEKTLFILCFSGGSIAMYITMRLIRHKTLHMRFMIGIPFIILLQAVLFGIIYRFLL